MMKSLFAFVTGLLLCNFVIAQKIEYKELLNANVLENGTNLLNPFCGGINSTQLNHADLNNDGRNDLVIWDNNTNTLRTFINIGASGTELYQYQPKFAKNFPRVYDYVKLIDYNCDNVPDLFHKGSAGFSVSYGTYNNNNELTFTFYRELYFPGSFGPVNAYVQPNDIPIIEDVDGDGDLDFISFDVLGAYAPFYKNLRVEDNLPCDSIRIIQETPCYGSMYQAFWREYVLNASCKGISSKNNNQRHSGNCILSFDFNGDGLMDFMGGNVSFNDAQLLINGGTATNALFTSQDTLFDAGGHELELYSWPAPFYFDIDNDNDKDLVFTPHNDNLNSANYNAVAVYENIGSTASPNFIWRNDSALVKGMIDVGRNSHPTLFDYNKDGKLDLFLGGEGVFNSVTKTRESKLSYYLNNSTNGNISFELVTRDFLNLSAKNYDGIYPTFGDITGDGIDDMVLGNDSGTIAVFKNTSTQTATPNFVWQTDSLPGIDVGNYSFPIIHDLNGDSKTDLLIGNEVGVLAFYQDTSATNSKEFKRIDSAVGDVKAGSAWSYFSYAVPFIAPADSTNKNYLFVGTEEGTIERYDSFYNQTNNWVRIDSQMSQIQTAYRAAPAVGDLDGDQRPELLIGNQNGGLYIFQFVTTNSNVGVINLSQKNIPISLYPNPAKHQLWIETPSPYSSLQSYTIRDISGRIVQTSGFHNLNESISIENLNAGFYMIDIVFSDENRAVGKFMKQF